MQTWFVQFFVGVQPSIYKLWWNYCDEEEGSSVDETHLPLQLDLLGRDGRGLLKLDDPLRQPEPHQGRIFLGGFSGENVVLLVGRDLGRRLHRLRDRARRRQAVVVDGSDEHLQKFEKKKVRPFLGLDTIQDLFAKSIQS